METKRYTKCLIVKSLTEFYRSRKYKDKHMYWCKQCMKEYLRKWRVWIKKTYPKHVAKMRTKHKRKHNQQWPQRYKARELIKNRIISGKIKRPERCSNCGVLCKPDSHHPDYSKPLQIEWLCRCCHLAAHGKRVG